MSIRDLAATGILLLGVIAMGGSIILAIHDTFKRSTPEYKIKMIEEEAKRAELDRLLNSNFQKEMDNAVERGKAAARKEYEERQKVEHP